MKAVLIPGDGIGREIAESVRAVSAALNTGIEWQECEAGAEYAEVSGELIAPGTLDAIEAQDGLFCRVGVAFCARVWYILLVR